MGHIVLIGDEFEGRSARLFKAQQQSAGLYHGESVGRGWVSSRRVRTFEDALIFVLDVERCLKKLTNLDRQMISRVLLQEYTQAETAVLLGVSVRTICTKLPQAIDRLTESLVESDLLTLPN